MRRAVFALLVLLSALLLVRAFNDGSWDEEADAQTVAYAALQTHAHGVDVEFVTAATSSSSLGAGEAVPSSPSPSPSPSVSTERSARRRSMTDLEDDPVMPGFDGEWRAPASASASESAPHHAMRPMQSTAAWNMQRLCATAPFSPRIQPGLMYRTREINYLQVGTGLRQRLGAGYLMMYEGAMTNRTGGPTLAIENDVWISNDNGGTWDLIAGFSAYGRSGPTSAPGMQANTFVGRSGSNNCNDPLSDLVVSLGGINPVTGNSTTVSYSSVNGQQWLAQAGTPFSPQRHFSSCDINERGDVFLIGGHYQAVNVRQEVLLNDIWVGTGVVSLNNLITWRRVTAAAPFSAREEHLVLVAWSSYFKKEILYVIGGRVTCTTFDCYGGVMANDVWASSDSGVTWAVINAAPGFGPRWGHGGWATKDGVLLVWGGLNTPTGAYVNTVTQRDLWASFDGGFTWRQCNTPNTEWIRGEQGSVVNPTTGQLILVAGYAYSENGVFQVRYNDVWSSNIPGGGVENTNNVAARCGGMGAVPSAGVGLRAWPGNPAVPQNTMTFTALTLRAPWSPRFRPGLLLMDKPITYKLRDGTSANTGPNWLVFYEGHNVVYNLENLNENDVYASADNGTTWNLISGIARRGQLGNVESAYPTSSFAGSISSANCEDPLTDDVYTLGGLRWNNTQPTGFFGTNDVWHSSNALVWTKRMTKVFEPVRSSATCDVGHMNNIILIAGESRLPGGGGATTYLNDVWTSTNRGITWSRTTARAPFPVRMDHAMQITWSDLYMVDLIYVVGGQTQSGTTLSPLNDVWVSSNGGVQWRSLVARAPWQARRGLAVVITHAGAMLLAGGADTTDIWASLNGGVRWTQCRLQAGQTVTVNQPAVTLTAEERLLIGSGSPRTDLWQSDVSLSQPSVVARLCQGSMPADGMGLIIEGWEPAGANNGTSPDADPSTTSSSGLTTWAVLLIVLAVLLALAAVYWLWRRQQQTGSWNPLQQGSKAGDFSTLNGEPHAQSSLPLDTALLGDTAAAPAL